MAKDDGTHHWCGYGHATCSESHQMALDSFQQSRKLALIGRMNQHHGYRKSVCFIDLPGSLNGPESRLGPSCLSESGPAPSIHSS